jgi:hypothetical protein
VSLTIGDRNSVGGTCLAHNVGKLAGPCPATETGHPWRAALHFGSRPKESREIPRWAKVDTNQVHTLLIMPGARKLLDKNFIGS